MNLHRANFCVFVWLTAAGVTLFAGENAGPLAATNFPGNPADYDLLPVETVTSLLAKDPPARSRKTVHLRGSVLDQRLGEYVVIRDDTGTITAETHLTLLPEINEQVDVWGTPVWDGARVRLEDSVFRVVNSGSPSLAGAAAVPLKPVQLPVLTNAWEVRDLPAERAAWNYPVRLHAVVTVNARRDESFFVQDNSSGIYIWARERIDVKPGDVVDIEGVSDPGGFAPIVLASSVTVVGSDSLPPARPVTLFQLSTGQDGSQWIEVRGVVRSLLFTNGVARLTLNDPSGMLRVNIPTSNEPVNLMDAIVRVKGVCGSEANSKRQLTVLQMWASSMDYLQIEEPGIVNPLNLPAQPIVSLSQFRPRQTLQHRINVSGIVTFVREGQSFFIQDNSDGIQVLTSQKGEVKPGDRVLAAGYPALADYRSVLRDAVFRVVSSGEAPEPELVLPGQSLNPQLHDRRVRVVARLSSSTEIGRRHVLTLQMDDRIFEAQCFGSIPDIESIPAGSMLQVTGIYRVLADEARTPSSFQILVPAAADIRVLQQPSWWTFRHTASVLAAMAVFIAAGCLWVFMLRGKVRDQTANLQQSESKFRTLVEQSLVGVYIIQDGRFAYVNPRLAEIFGYKTDELMLQTVESTVAPEDAPQVREQIEQRLRGKIKTAHYGFRGQRKDGSLVHVEVLGSLSEFEGRAAVLGTALDVTERKQADEELFKSRQMLRTVLDNIPQGVFWKNKNSVYLGGNQAFARDCGFADQTELSGKTDDHTRSAEMAELYRADDRAVMETGKARIGYEQLQIRADGTRGWLKTNKVPLFDKNGNVTGVLGTYEDITVQKRAETALAETSSLLETMLENSPDYIYFKDCQSRFVRVSRSLARAFNFPDSSHLIGKTDFDFFLEEHARPAFEDEQEIIRTGQPIIGKGEKETHIDGRTTWALTTKLPWRDRDGNIIGTFGISKDVTAAKETEQKLEYERGLFHALANNLPDAIYFKDRESRFVRLSRSKVERFRQILVSQHRVEQGADSAVSLPDHLTSNEKCSAYLIGKTDFDVYSEERARASFEDEQRIILSNEPLVGKLDKMVHPDGSQSWYLTTKMPWRDHQGNVVGTFGVSADITALKEAEAQLEMAHRRLIETSRLAGMAEVATDVLHNVGNVLNSVNVSCSLTIERIRALKVANLTRVAALLEENKGRLGEFLSRDPRGVQVPGYLTALSEHLASDQVLVLKELEQLLKHVDHIKQIVAMQQNYAKVAGVTETISPVQLVEDALQINAAALTRHIVNVHREFQEMPPINTEKHKVMQILVNLIRNAKYALDESEQKEKVLTVTLGSDGNGSVKIEVIDNGVGIAQENLTRIFGHGFTTRADGHGFGLHSSALAIRELGGSLQAYSDGPGKGARFTLLIPYKPSKQPEPNV